MQQSVLLSVAAAAEHPLIDIDLTAVIQFGIFAVTFVVATTLVFRPYLRMRDARDAGIEGARQEATRLSAQAESQLADHDTKLDAARVRAQEERRKIRTDAAIAHRELTEKAKSDANATVTRARAKVEADADAARKDLLPRADRLATDIVAKLLGREVAR